MRDRLRISVGEMPKEMLPYGFPCGETDCPNRGTHEVILQALDAEYKFPTCAKHARDLEELLERTSRV